MTLTATHIVTSETEDVTYADGEPRNRSGDFPKIVFAQGDRVHVPERHAEPDHDGDVLATNLEHPGEELYEKRYIALRHLTPIEQVGVPQVGDPITTAEAWDQLPIGAEVTGDDDEWVYTKVADSDVLSNGSSYTATYVDPESGGTGTFFRPWNWRVRVTSLPEQASAPTRPLIDFSGSSRETAREYAEALRSPKSLSPAANAVLAEIVDGQKVDAYRLNETVLAVMRSAANRGRNADDRRALGRKAAYLGHIVQAVLENHADELPAYAEGQRSRLLEEVGTTLQEAREALEEASTDLKATKAASAEYREAAEAEVSRLMNLIDERTEQRNAAEAARDAYASTLSYAVERLESGDRERVFGYLDGVTA